MSYIHPKAYGHIMSNMDKEESSQKKQHRANQSPLTLIVLALLEEHPMHVYGLHKLMLERGQDDLVNIGRRNSVQQVLTRLHRDGYAETVDGDTGRRVVYRITQEGSGLLYDWLRDEIGEPSTEYPRFTAAVSLLGFLSPTMAADLLAARRARMSEDAAGLSDELARGTLLPTVLTLEVDLRLAMIQAEIEWLDRVIARLEAGELSWDLHELLALSTAEDHVEAP